VIQLLQANLHSSAAQDVLTFDDLPVQVWSRKPRSYARHTSDLTSEPRTLDFSSRAIADHEKTKLFLQSRLKLTM